MRRVLNFLLFACGLTLLALLLLAWGGYRAARHEPEFYRRALATRPVESGKLGDELERQVLDLRNNLQQSGRWQTVFSEEQLNGWLAEDLPVKFPQLLPPGARDPRVEIADDTLRVACRFDNGQVATVVSFALQVQLAAEPNTLAIRLSRLRAGALPIALRQVLDPVTAAARKADIVLRWSQTGGDPVALVTVPSRHKDFVAGEIRLESVELVDHELRISGSTVPDDQSALEPSPSGP
jgi:hypothetical protein